MRKWWIPKKILQEHKKDQEIIQILDVAIETEREKTQKIAEDTRRMDEVKAANHLVEGILGGFASRSRGAQGA